MQSVDVAYCPGYERLSGHRTPGDIVVLRKLLESETDPIDRHYMLGELGRCHYKSRDAFASALEELDAVCGFRDAEVDSIRPPSTTSSAPFQSSR